MVTGCLRAMNWDEVARELFVIHARMDRMSNDYRALAEALHREFENSSLGITRGDAPGAEKEKNRKAAAVQPSFPNLKETS